MKHFFSKTKHYNKCIYFTLKSYIVSKEFTYVNVFYKPYNATAFHIGCVAEWSKALIPMRSSRRGVGLNPIMAIYIFIFFFSLCFVFEKFFFILPLFSNTCTIPKVQVTMLYDACHQHQSQHLNSSLLIGSNDIHHITS